MNLLKLLQWKEPRELSRIKRKRKIVAVFHGVSSNFSGLFWAVGLAAVLLFPLSLLQKHAFIDENALLPGSAKKLLGLQEETQTLRFKSSLDAARHLPSSQRAGHVHAHFSRLKLRTAVQRFSHLNASSHQWLHAENVYAVYTPPRSDGAEAIVVSAPWHDIHGAYNSNGIALLLGLAAFVQQHVFWARAFIFIIPGESPLGTLAWLKAYHGDQHQPNLTFDPLPLRAGIIQEAIHLEFGHIDVFTHVGLFVHGLNGQQPNADLISTLVKIAEYDGIPLTLHNRHLANALHPVRMNYGDTIGQYAESFINVVEFMAYQGLGLPLTDHALYAQYRIESITLFGVNQPTYRKGLGLLTVSRLTESLLRSLNNLLERLHHSFWFYILAGTDKFIMLSVYITPVLCIFIGVILQSIRLWYSHDIIPYNTLKNQCVLKGIKHDYAQRPDGIPSFSRTYRTFTRPCLIMILCHTISLVIYTQRLSGTSTLILFYTSAFLIALFSRYSSQKPSKIPQGFHKLKEWKVLKCLICYQVSLTLLITASMNPSAVVGYGMTLVPFLLFIQPLHTIKGTFHAALNALLFCILFILSSPIGVAGLYYLAMNLSGSFVLMRGISLPDTVLQFAKVLIDVMRDGYDYYGGMGYVLLVGMAMPSVLGGVWIAFMNEKN